MQYTISHRIRIQHPRAMTMSRMQLQIITFSSCSLIRAKTEKIGRSDEKCGARKYVESQSLAFHISPQLNDVIHGLPMYVTRINLRNEMLAGTCRMRGSGSAEQRKRRMLQTSLKSSVQDWNGRQALAQGHARSSWLRVRLRIWNWCGNFT